MKPTKLLKEAALDYRQEHFNAKEFIINGSELFDKITDYDDSGDNRYTLPVK